MTTRFVLLASLAMLLCSGAVRAEIYKWVDESGSVHYGDRPAQGSATQLDITVDAPGGSSAPGSGMSREEMRARLLNSMEQDRQELRQRRAEQEQKQSQNRQICARYRDSLRQLREVNKLYTLDDNGERVYLSDAERDARASKMRAEMRRYCR